MAEAGKVHPVILSGGSGSRLWPLSRASYPKQLLPLMGDDSLLQETAGRVSDRGRFHPVLVIANDEHRFVVAEQLRDQGLTDARIVLEPVGRNTAPAAAVAALLIEEEDPEGVMLLLPSDHVIGDAGEFQRAVDRAQTLARDGMLVTFGVQPTHPSTEYGYIKRGAGLGGEGCFRVDRFVEKPDAATAQSYLDSGDHAWNSGMFVFPVRPFLAELEAFNPDIVAACRKAAAGRGADLDFIRLDAAAFAESPTDSIDYAVMEKTGKAAVVTADFRWNDVGAWNALWDLAEKDGDGNALIGDVVAEDVAGCYLRNEDGGLVAALGLRDLCVVATGDAVFVAPRARASEVKALVERLAGAGRGEITSHPRVHRPWGAFTDIERGGRFKVKRLVVKPGGRLSLQRHKHRTEHWVVVEGTATVVNGDKEFTLQRDQSTYIDAGAIHRLENRTDRPLHLIEVQVGDYLEEDDIERLQDDYKRG
jgi:mannose-1-phosphate guanylyltransferase/mannose-6-phosphate isomerase